jgi:hypothetical protein
MLPAGCRSTSLEDNGSTGPPRANVGRVTPEEPYLDPDDEPEDRPLLPHERADVLDEIEELASFRVLLEPRGIRGLSVDCDDCGEMHFLGWELLVENLRNLLDDGRMRVHEPAYDPDPADYVSWDYARGYADAVLDADTSE